MSDTPVDEGPAADIAAEPEDRLARAAAQGRLDWDDDERPGDVSNLEAGAAHDSPAAVDEERAERQDGDQKDSMSSIYGPPPGDRSADIRE